MGDKSDVAACPFKGFAMTVLVESVMQAFVMVGSTVLATAMLNAIGLVKVRLIPNTEATKGELNPIKVQLNDKLS